MGFKLKHDGTYHARLVALGYSQVPVVDFTYNFAPVVNDITFQLMLSRKIIKKLSTRIIDMETAFLYGELEDKIYMETPVGYVRNNTSNSGPPWMMDKCGPPRSRPIEVLIAHKLIL